jgi:uncharacterized protein GlcG (DUF336 family)
MAAKRMTLDLATKICNAVVLKSQEKGWGPVAVIVVDAAGFNICSMCVNLDYLLDKSVFNRSFI